MSNGSGPGKGFLPIEINSRNAFFPHTKFDNKFIKAHKKTCGIVTVDQAAINSLGTGFSAPGFDLVGNPMSGTAILIDWGYVLMRNHFFKSISMTVGNSGMENHKVRVVFNNEITAASLNLPHPSAEAERPTAYLRGDVYAWTGTNDSECEEDFAIVRIDWGKNHDFDKIGITARLQDPSNAKSSDLMDKKLCTFMQYSASRPVKINSKTSFSTHVAMGPVTAVDQSPPDDSCPNKKKCYAYIENTATPGSSGGGVFNEKGELVAIVCGGGYLNKKRQTYILPLEYIYKCKAKYYGTESGNI